MASNTPRNFSVVTVLHNVAAALVVTAVLGIWNAASSTSEKMNKLADTMEGVRRDVDRHESLLMRFNYLAPDLTPEVRRETQRQY